MTEKSLELNLKDHHSVTTCLVVFSFMDYGITDDDSEVLYFLCELAMNYGVLPIEQYDIIETKYPQYFDANGFIPYNLYLDTILWMPDVKGFCAYILYLDNGKTYKGYTAHFRNRMIAHFSNKGCKYTKWHTPLYILHYEVLQTRKEALDREQYFKRFSGIDKIRERFGELNTIYPFLYNK